MFTLIRNANLYAPAKLGKRDILICGGKIVAVEADLQVSGLKDCRTVDVRGAVVTPGAVDGHAHLIGGGGEGGFHTRTPEVTVEQLTMAGITTVAGLLGTDTLTRHPESLLSKVGGLTHEGISAYMFTGGYKYPSPTITGHVDRDIAFIDRVIGAKIAIADHRSSQLSSEELSRLASQARVGGMISGKAGIVVVHLGAGRGGFSILNEVVSQDDIPIRQFMPTHVNRTKVLFDEALAWCLQGGYIDFTSATGVRSGDGVKSSEGIARCLAENINFDQVCMSTDGNGSLPRFDAQQNFTGLGVAGFEGLWAETFDLMSKEHVPLETALRPITINPATALGLSAAKGSIEAGKDADLVVFDENFTLTDVFARGRQMVANAQPVVFGTFSRGN